MPTLSFPSLLRLLVLDPVFVPARLDLPNEYGLSADSPVRIFVVGGTHALDVDMSEGEWSEWEGAGATVSGDGLRIQTESASGISYLTWFGIYPPLL